MKMSPQSPSKLLLKWDMKKSIFENGEFDIKMALEQYRQGLQTIDNYRFEAPPFVKIRNPHSFHHIHSFHKKFECVYNNAHYTPYSRGNVKGIIFGRFIKN